MLEMTKQILEKVSFDRDLFRKELLKAIQWLKKEESQHLKIWALTKFAIYADVINMVFSRNP